MYHPAPSLLKKYADILVKFALNSGQGVRPKEVVQVLVPDVAKPMYGVLQASILESGAYPLMRLLATGFDYQFFTLASDDQLQFFPKTYLKARIDLIDHQIAILADHNLHELEKIDPKKIILNAESQKQVRTWLTDKEYRHQFTWTLGLYGTPAMAAEVGLSLKTYWEQIIAACFLDLNDPIAKWQAISAKQELIKKQLNQLPIHTIRVKAKDTDIQFTLGEKRRFIGGGGRNIPSFEIFTSPDWRGTEGHISFDQPFYRYGILIRDIKLKFVQGVVVKATANTGQKLLTEIINRPNANKVGEFSMTDNRMSRITKFMANTLFDENIGGPYGNMHLAVGMSYKDTYASEPIGVPKKKWRMLGFNDSGEHCDFVMTHDREISVTLKDGTQKIIYTRGHFTL